jgi:hypothetical protein
MKKMLLGIIAAAILIASCSSAEHKKWERNWEGPIISPMPFDKPSHMP